MEIAREDRRFFKLAQEVSDRSDDKVKLRLTHPNKYRGLTTHAAIILALGVNFLILTPAFNPLDIPKMATGYVFVAVAVAKLITLNVGGVMWRLTSAISITLMFAWGTLQIAAFYQLKMTSLQSPILYFGLAIVEIWILIEPYTNPVTQRQHLNGNGE